MTDLYLCQNCRKVQHKIALKPHPMCPERYSCIGCGRAIDDHNKLHLHHLQEAFDAVKIMREQKKQKPLENTTREIQRKQTDGVEAYLRLYLELSGKKIEDLELCMRTKYEGTTITVEHWLEDKKC